jgi:hypothetical protein
VLSGKAVHVLIVKENKTRVLTVQSAVKTKNADALKTQLSATTRPVTQIAKIMVECLVAQAGRRTACANSVKVAIA